MSPETNRSAKYFSTNEEYDSKPKNLVHEYGVLKRAPNSGSTPSFKPYQTSSQKQISMFSSNENLPSNDTMGNKFDELEQRLISLENTLDGRPGEDECSPTNGMSSQKSYNPFSPQQNQNVYVRDERAPNTNQEYDSGKLPDKYISSRHNSPRYVDSSTEQNDDNEADEQENQNSLKSQKLENLLQRSERDNFYSEQQLKHKDDELERLKYDLERKNEEYDTLYFKYENLEKDNENLKTTFKVLREQEMEKIKANFKTSSEKQQVIEDLKQQLETKDREISSFTDRLSEMGIKLKDNNQTIERLSNDKEALAKIADTSSYDDKIKTLEQDLAHYKGLLDNERRSRQTTSENLSKKDSQIDDIERVNYELTNQVDLKCQIIHNNENDLNNLRYKIQDSAKENETLQNELRDQNERIHELESDLAQ